MKKKNNSSPFVYSTNPDFKPLGKEEFEENLLPENQKLRIWLETKHRGGKAATVITDFVGKEYEMKELGKQLKNHCGTGGSVKDGEIIIQGDQREKVLQWLLSKGFKQTKKAGG